MSELNENITKIFYTFTQNILNIDRSVRWVVITDKNDIIINERDRPRLKPLL